MTTLPTWFLRLQDELPAPVEIPDGAINWDQCRDCFLISLLQRIEGRSNSPHPAIVRELLQRRLTGEDVEAKLVAAKAAAAAAVAAWAAASSVGAADTAAAAAAAAAAADDDDVADDERLAQASDLRAALAASTERPTLPDGYIDDNITGLDRKLLSAFYAACNSEGGTADEIHLRGIHAALARWGTPANNTREANR